jgi:hypothetical protein
MFLKSESRFFGLGGQRVTSSTVCDTNFELARHEFNRHFHVLRDLCAVDLVLALPWLDDAQAPLKLGAQ